MRTRVDIYIMEIYSPQGNMRTGVDVSTSTSWRYIARREI